MTDVAETPTCRRCGRLVVLAKDQIGVFEGMHYVCFHYEFEHDPVDPDEECEAGGCPSAAINPRPERRPDTVIALRTANAWFARRGFEVRPSQVDYSDQAKASAPDAPSADHHSWVDLWTVDGRLARTAYGSGPSLAAAAERACERWRVEQDSPV